MDAKSIACQSLPYGVGASLSSKQNIGFETGGEVGSSLYSTEYPAWSIFISVEVTASSHWCGVEVWRGSASSSVVLVIKILM
ncbi:hypothetical protein AVEN_142740-1 [Araneus ventricosus]|uniref:Uncharacterized protein n=1 Tax=Araneus ventricosus TaxID=182803 RepID=A0A4Y2QBH9_ARAVE|nr:hypothetical protein AVEN_142740-1 [Araneus ventricosus]